MKTIHFFNVCEFVRSGTRVYVRENICRLIDLGKDLLPWWDVVEEIELSTGQNLLVLRPTT